jgi:hypothetical protein
MADPLAGEILSQFADGAMGFDIVCALAVQFSDPAP